MTRGISRSRRSEPLALALGVVLLALAGWRLLAGRRARAHRTSGAVRGPVTQAMVPNRPAHAGLGQPGHNLEERLDEAIEESFPASDPIAVSIE
jgi:hypothetical protein